MNIIEEKLLSNKLDKAGFTSNGGILIRLINVV